MNGQRLVHTQTERQIQKLSPQQLLSVRILELPIVELEQRVKDEVIDNVALEECRDKHDDELENTVEQETEEEREYDSVLFDEYDDGGEYHQYLGGSQQNDLPIGDTKSFADDLESQISEYDLTDKQIGLMKYLIGSLNDKGFIDTPLQKISDDMLIYLGLDVSVQELEEVLHVLQDFDPPGIGARDIKESLSIQLRRLEFPEESVEDRTRMLAIQIVDCMYDQLLLKQYGLIATKLQSTESEVMKAIELISRMSPTPGRPLNEEATDSKKAVIPDVIITTDDEQISWMVNYGNMPHLEINADYQQQLAAFQTPQVKLSPRMRAAYKYMKNKVNNAEMFINAIAQRQHTLNVTTKALVELQHDFLLSQDDNDLKPITLTDVARLAGVDVSTVSRVNNSKYVLLDGRTYPFSHFFIRARQNAKGEILIRNDVNNRIKEIIDNETKQHPYADDEIVALLAKQGLNLSRRTVAKYRKNLGYPISTKRR